MIHCCDGFENLHSQGIRLGSVIHYVLHVDGSEVVNMQHLVIGIVINAHIVTVTFARSWLMGLPLRLEFTPH